MEQLRILRDSGMEGLGLSRISQIPLVYNLAAFLALAAYLAPSTLTLQGKAECRTMRMYLVPSPILVAYLVQTILGHLRARYPTRLKRLRTCSIKYLLNIRIEASSVNNLEHHFRCMEMGTRSASSL